MSSPDPVATGLVVAAALQAAKQAQDFITAASGHKGESLGTILGDLVDRRLHNAETVTGKAHLILLNIGLKAGEIPLNVLQPALEGASLQEDPTLQETWANLLANAADPRNQTPIPQIFVSILRDFGSVEVRFLNYLWDAADERLKVEIQFSNPSQIRFSVDRLMIMWNDLGFAHLTNLAYNEFWIMLGILQRGNVVGDIVEIPDLIGAGEGVNKLERTYHLTDLGSAFVLACRPPKRTLVI